MYNIAFTVGRDTVAPPTPQRAGVFGDKGKAAVTFTLEQGFSPGANCQYRVEVTDGAGGYDVTELMLPQNGKISLVIPASWTAAGTAALRLVAVELDDDLNEEERWHSVPAFITFDERSNGERIVAASGPEWRETLNKAKRAADTAAACAVDCKAAQEETASAASAAIEAAENTAKAFEEALQVIVSSEGVTAEFAHRSETSAANAEQSRVQAIAAKDIAFEASLRCGSILEQVEELSGLTAEIRQVVGV